MESSGSVHKTEVREVMPKDFNTENCVRCSASKGEIERRDDDLISRECQLQQAITEGRLIVSSRIGREVEEAFKAIGIKPECNAFKHFDILRNEVNRERWLAGEALKRMGGFKKRR